jgi:hypothetical protein
MHPQLDGLYRTSVELFWLPLGAGDALKTVRWNGRMYEALMSKHEHREPRDLYHSALQVHLNGDRFVIEMVPSWDSTEPDRGVVAEGPVGLRCLGRSRLFRYEVRSWLGGVIPDASESVESPVRLSSAAEQARALLNLVPEFPTATWGRDEQRTGEMWNSNSLISWLLARSGHRTDVISPPVHGRAPGWSAGLTVAARSLIATSSNSQASGSFETVPHAGQTRM